jgi:hypothetical protein
MPEATEPDEGTIEAERVDSGRPHVADRPPTAAEEAEAEAARTGEEASERRSVAEHYEEMAELGAEAKGEGEIK